MFLRFHCIRFFQVKRAALHEMVEYVTTNRNVLTESTYPEVNIPHSTHFTYRTARGGVINKLEKIEEKWLCKPSFMMWRHCHFELLLITPFGHKSFIFFIFFITRPSTGLLPVLGPLGSGTDATHQPSPALRLLGCWWSQVECQVVRLMLLLCERERLIIPKRDSNPADWRLLSVHYTTVKNDN